MAKKWNLPTHILSSVLDFYNPDEVIGVTGLSFYMNGGYFMTCTCGHQESNPHNHFKTCSKCGGNIKAYNAKRYDRIRYCKLDSARTAKKVTITNKTLFLWHDDSIGEFKVEFEDDVIVEGKLSPLSVNYPSSTVTYRSYGVAGRAIEKLCNEPEFSFFKDIISCMGYGYSFNNTESFREMVKAIVEMGLDYSSVKKNANLYSSFIYEYINRRTYCTDLKDWLKEKYATPETIQILEKIPYDENRSFAQLDLAIQALNTAKNIKMPHLDYFLELISRGVIKYSTLADVITVYNMMVKEKMMPEYSIPVDSKGKYDLGFYRRSIYLRSCNKVKVPKDVAEDFITFCRRYINTKDVVSEFCYRYAVLNHLGIPVVYDNMLDKPFNRAVNNTRFLYTGEDFDEKFRKNAMAMLANMK